MKCSTNFVEAEPLSASPVQMEGGYFRRVALIVRKVEMVRESLLLPREPVNQLYNFNKQLQ